MFLAKLANTGNPLFAMGDSQSLVELSRYAAVLFTFRGFSL
jgi:hypothetical protein